jgi:hypothetical protein
MRTCAFWMCGVRVCMCVCDYVMRPIDESGWVCGPSVLAGKRVSWMRV